MAIVVPTFRRRNAAVAVVDSLHAELGPHDEVLVVDQSAPEDHLRLVGAFGARGDRRIRVIHTRPSLPEARNRAVERTDRELILFFDDDVVVRPGCLAGHRAAYEDPTVGGVVGRIVETVLQNNARGTVNRVTRTGRIVTCLEGTVAVDIDSLKGANMSFRRLALEQAGPFDAGYKGTSLLEDADVSERVRSCGWRLRYEPQAVVLHHHLPTGGVRQDTAARTLYWRFYNTGRFVGRYRPKRDVPLVLATHAAIAVLHAVRQGNPTLPGQCLLGLARGMRSSVGISL